MYMNFFPVISYVLISTFTPGPSNITSASMGVLYGYRKTLTFQAGLAAGLCLVMVLSGWISSEVLSAFPILVPLIHYIGAAYILFLAINILRESYAFNDDNPKPMGLLHGILLQIFNPKLIVYALTLFSAVLPPWIKSPPQFFSAVIILTATSFCATTVWALFGTAIKSVLHYPRVKIAINIILSLLLVLSALQVAGLL